MPPIRDRHLVFLQRGAASRSAADAVGGLGLVLLPCLVAANVIPKARLATPGAILRYIHVLFAQEMSVLAMCLSVRLDLPPRIGRSIPRGGLPHANDTAPTLSPIRHSKIGPRERMAV